MTLRRLTGVSDPYLTASWSSISHRYLSLLPQPRRRLRGYFPRQSPLARRSHSIQLWLAQAFAGSQFGVPLRAPSRQLVRGFPAFQIGSSCEEKRTLLEILSSIVF